MQELRRMLRGDAEAGERLDIPAAQIATIEYPDLDTTTIADSLDAIAAQVIPPAPGGRAFVQELNEALFRRIGFQGNDSDYYDPRNSCLNQVLERRTGIPITLSVIYLEVARRLGQPVFGIALPGHFIVEFDGPDYSAFLDPFHSGKALTPAECERLVASRTGATVEPGALSFRKATGQQIVTRMLQNLKGIYMSRQQWANALPVADLLVEAAPDAPYEWRARAVANLNLKRYGAAKTDLERYLQLAPGAPDRQLIEEQLANLNRWAAQWN